MGNKDEKEASKVFATGGSMTVKLNATGDSTVFRAESLGRIVVNPKDLNHIESKDIVVNTESIDLARLMAFVFCGTGYKGGAIKEVVSNFGVNIERYGDE